MLKRDREKLDMAVETCHKLAEYGVDITPLLELERALSDLVAKKSDANAKLAALRPGKNFDRDYADLSKSQSDLEGQEEILLGLLVSVAHDIRIVAHDNAGGAADELLAEIDKEDGEVVEALRTVYNAVTRRVAVTEKLTEYQNLQKSAEGDYPNELGEIGWFTFLRLPWQHSRVYPRTVYAAIKDTLEHFVKLNPGSAGQIAPAWFRQRG